MMPVVTRRSQIALSNQKLCLVMTLPTLLFAGGAADGAGRFIIDFNHCFCKSQRNHHSKKEKKNRRLVRFFAVLKAQNVFELKMDLIIQPSQPKTDSFIVRSIFSSNMLRKEPIMITSLVEMVVE